MKIKREYKIMALIVLAFALLVWLVSCDKEELQSEPDDSLLEKIFVESEKDQTAKIVKPKVERYCSHTSDPFDYILKVTFDDGDVRYLHIHDGVGDEITHIQAFDICSGEQYEFFADSKRSEILCSYGQYTIYNINGVWYESYVNNGQVDSYELEDPDGNPADETIASNRCKQLAGIYGQ